MATARVTSAPLWYRGETMSDAHFRRAARTAIELVVHYRRDEPGATLEKAGRIADLGMGGAFVHTERPPGVGTPVLLRLAAPTAWDPLELVAEVRWVSAALPRGFGVAWSGLSPAQANALYELVVAGGFSEAPS